MDFVCCTGELDCGFLFQRKSEKLGLQANETRCQDQANGSGSLLRKKDHKQLLCQGFAEIKSGI